jgi:hypothetical protein
LWGSRYRLHDVKKEELPADAVDRFGALGDLDVWPNPRALFSDVPRRPLIGTAKELGNA